MRTLCVLSLFALLVGPAFPAGAQQHEDHPDHEAAAPMPPAEPGPFQAVVTVQGLVCSFCAVGATKALAKIEGLDRARYTKGVHVDIENQRITLAFQPGVTVPVVPIQEAVRSAGYEPVSLQIDLEGWQATK